MTRVQFLNDLYLRLGALKKEQAEEWLVYYAEMLADRMEEGMTEEEAVASMEDLDTIAVRILQEAGLPPEAMTDPRRPVTPPAYPNPPAGGGGGKRAYRPPKRRSSLNTFLWILAGIAVVFAGSRWVFYNLIAPAPNTATGSAAYDTFWTESGASYDPPDLVQGDGYGAVDSGEYSYAFMPEGMEITSVVDAITGTMYTVSQWDDGSNSVWRAESVDGELVSSLHIDWPSGVVTVRADDSGSFPWFRTTGSEAVWSIHGGILTITQNGSAEELEVWVPSWLCVNLEIETEDAAVTLAGATYSTITVETGSGNVVLENLESNEDLEIITGSGNVSGTAAYLWNADVATGSGAVELKVETGMDLSFATGSGDLVLEILDPCVNALDLETGSGNIRLSMWEGTGFQLKWRTDSGALDSGPFALTQRSNGRYECGAGGIRIDAETGSGDLTLDMCW